MLENIHFVWFVASHSVGWCLGRLKILLHCDGNACKRKKLRYGLTTWAPYINSTGNFLLRHAHTQSLVVLFTSPLFVHVRSYFSVAATYVHLKMHGKFPFVWDDPSDLRLRVANSFYQYQNKLKFVLSGTFCTTSILQRWKISQYPNKFVCFKWFEYIMKVFSSQQLLTLHLKC